MVVRGGGSKFSVNGVKVPDNLKKLGNYFFNLDPRCFKSGGGGGDALASLRPGKKD
jgi:hypothetical protein